MTASDSDSLENEQARGADERSKVDANAKGIEPDPPSSTRRRKRKRKRKRQHAEDNDGDKSTTAGQGPGAAQTHESRDEQVSRTVFVEGIPYTCSEEEVKDVFKSLHIVDLRLPRWQDSGRLRGFGHVVLQTEEDYQQALKLSSKCFLKGRYLTIQPAKAPSSTVNNTYHDSSSRSSQPSRTILLQNLSYDATEEDIEKVLTRYGSIVTGGIRIVRHNNKRSRGFGYVEFACLDAARKVVEQQRATNNGGSGVVILNRPCRVDYDHGEIRKSYKTATGRLWQKQYGHLRHEA